MTRTTCVAIIALSFSMLFQVLPVSGQEEQKTQEWTGRLRYGKILTINGLENILADHKKWIKTNRKGGKRANLKEANLKEATLYKANLREAYLGEADLSKANLHKANLSGARLSKANLNEANLKKADLSKAILYKTNLREAKLWEANLREAGLREANLSKAELQNANLREAFLWEADLSGARLSKANLSNASLYNANLSNASLYEANLSKANLHKANLHKASLYKANLKEANLSGANLSQANLYEVDLKDCILDSTTQLPLIYEPKAGSPPYIPSIAIFPNLSKLTFKKSPHGLVDLREGFKKLGYRKQEREITYAIKYTQRYNLWNSKNSNIWNKFESLFSYFFFELTCQYGLKPGRPLLILVGFIFIFTIPYSEFLSREGEDGIWKIWIEERVRKDIGTKESERLYFIGIPAIKKGFYFSVLSAFSIGWRELNVGNWIARIQRYEYVLKATGWARAISGIQSLISVYLIALWVLTYFGRPFEAI